MKPLAFAAILVVLAACDEHRTITLELGPDDHTLTAGFACRAETGEPLIEHAHRGAIYSFQLVIDTVELGDTFPGCRGEEVLAACGDHACSRIGRFCTTIALPEADITDQAAILAALHAQIGHPLLIADAPGNPVVVRAVTTLQSCADVLPVDATYPRLDPDQAIGCAYSCPVILDEITGSLGMALDTLDDHCAPQVHQCAKLGG
jgi:hypothetical protein